MASVWLMQILRNLTIFLYFNLKKKPVSQTMLAIHGLHSDNISWKNLNIKFWAVAHFWIFRLFINGKFDTYVLWPLAKRVQNWIVGRSTTRNFTILQRYHPDGQVCVDFGFVGNFLYKKRADNTKIIKIIFKYYNIKE